MNNQYQIRVIDSMESWAGIAGPWNKLLMQSMSDTIFLSYEWLSAWAETYINDNRKLFIITIHDEDELIGVAPFYIRSLPSGIADLKQIEFLGAPEAGSDYLDVIVRKRKEMEVARSLYDFLLKDASSLWDSLALRDIPSNSLFLLHLLNMIEEDGKYVEIRSGSFCPIVSLPKTVDDFNAGLSSHRRLQLNRHFKILYGDGDVEHKMFIGEEADSVLDDFFRLYSENKGLDGTELNLFLKKFASKARDHIQIDMLASKGKNIAGVLLLRYRDILSQYQMSSDKSFNPKISVGNILVRLCINKAIGQGISKYDFLKGPEQYKFHWADEGRSSVNVFFNQKKLVPALSVMNRFLKYTAKSILR